MFTSLVQLKQEEISIQKLKHVFIIIFVALCLRKLPKLRRVISEESDCDSNKAAAASAVLNVPLRRIQAKSPLSLLWRSAAALTHTQEEVIKC